MMIASKTHKNCSVFNKLKAVFLQSCGLTDVGIDAMCKLGETIHSRNLLNVRTDLAIKDENHIKQIASHSHIATVIDNLDKQVKRVINHKTLPILLCREVDNSVENMSNQRKTLDESQAQFKLDFFLMDNPSNFEEKESFMEVIRSKKLIKIFIFSL